jgi:hypothetical protein
MAKSKLLPASDPESWADAESPHSKLNPQIPTIGMR